MCITVIIPAYQPDKRLSELAAELSQNDFNVLIVDDGSGSTYSHFFKEASKYAHIITSKANHGKGHALKLGMESLSEAFPDTEAFITVDADGQHRITDVCRVADELCLGASIVLTRRELKKSVPMRSRIGNDLSRFVFALITGHYLYDNQSGLRGYLIAHQSWLVKVSGNRYDYEMNVLLFADKQILDFKVIPIQTVYIDGNRSSHFHPLIDTLRIYSNVAYSNAATLIALTLLCAFVVAVSVIHDWEYWLATVLLCGAVSIILSYLQNRMHIKNAIHYAIWTRLFTYTASRYLLYTGICALLLPTGLSFALSYFLAVSVCVPIKYFACKTIAVLTKHA